MDLNKPVFFPLKDSSSHVFMLAFGKIDVVNVRTFMLLMSHGDVSQISTIRGVMKACPHYFQATLNLQSLAASFIPAHSLWLVEFT